MTFVYWCAEICFGVLEPAAAAYIASLGASKLFAVRPGSYTAPLHGMHAALRAEHDGDVLACIARNILRTRYQSPDCAAHQRAVWSLIDQKVAVPVLRVVPALAGPLGFVQRWFTRL